MKGNKKILILSFLMANLVAATYAQNGLNSQYQQLKSDANDYQDYKVVKQTTMDAFWNRVQDSINVTKRTLADTRREIATQKAQLARLQKQLQAKETQMRQNNQAASEVTVLGIAADKHGYVTTSYFLYAALLGVLAFFFVRYQSSNRTTMGIRKDYEEAKGQVDEYKRKLLETQTSLGRELQTERNRTDELQQEINKLRTQTTR